MNVQSIGAGLLVGLLAAIVSSGCALENEPVQHHCTSKGCGSSLQVGLERAKWDVGEYHIDVNADGVQSHCVVAIPFTSCSNVMLCDQSEPEFELDYRCPDKPEGHEIRGLNWPTSGEGPASVTVEVSLVGNSLGTGSYQLSYTKQYINGEGCEPGCFFANATPVLQLQ